MDQLLSALGAGLGQGAVYALLALGFVIIYKSTHVISFAQPALMMSGAILTSYLSPHVGFAAAVACSAIGIGLAAAVVERLAIRPMIGKELFIIVMITIGIDLVIRAVAGAFVGAELRVVGDPWGLDYVSLFGIHLAERHLAIMAVGAGLVAALFLFFRYAPLGLAMRAAALDQEAAMTQGVNVGTVFSASWALAGSLAAVAGSFAATGRALDQNFWVVALAALPVIILGGLDSLGGAVVGGLIIGVLEQLAYSYHRELLPSLDANIGGIAPYLAMMLVLLVRPHGLFGTAEVRRV